jgi:hypothetical protein
MQKRWLIASVCAVIVGTAAPAYAQPKCACRMNAAKAFDEGAVGTTPAPRASAAPAAKALEAPSAKPPAASPTRRSLEIELNFFGRKYSVEFITTSELKPATLEHNAPPAPPVPASAPPVLG